ncbi:MAG TPA: tetratricopeptide repeat protein [Thermoanaerobaculia bacterium]|nr:tetratricopeptide repeat protein [Thermoanaerobaculia bacterium]
MVALALALSGCRRAPAGRAPASHAKAAAPPAPAAVFVGRPACEKCHAEEARRWAGSHHALAMQPADEKTVLGDFHDARFTHFGVTSTFFRRGGKFFARTDGPDGRLHDYEIAYTFGVYPLQQYLITFPGGRYQALNVCWDTRPAKEGGQRWFHLYPKEEVAHDDPLHWTGPYQNWNFMCAECHSTNVRKGFSPATDSYATTFSEIDVSCEACHGPGSAHAAWGEAVRAGKAKPTDADKGLVFALGDPVKASWIFDPKTGIAQRSAPRTSRVEIETCGRCHARRSVVAADYHYGRPLADTHRPVFLERGLYRADGQIEDEVYEYGSFLQSKMYAAGVSCSDCHNPHDLKVPVSADRVCAGCHQPDKFDVPAHHFHKAGSTGASCTACHMETRNYMVVHARHDHSFRVPRPDLTVAIGVPNACNDCHKDRSAEWASAAALKWWGGKRRESRHYGEAIHAGREVLAGAGPALADLARDSAKPAIVRGTALTLLAGENGPAPPDVIESALRDADPYVRRGAVAAAETLEPAERVRLLAPVLADPVRTVRIEAARALVSAPKEQLSPSDRSRFEAALSEFVDTQRLDADRAEAHVTLGALYAEQGDSSAAEAEYRKAIALLPAFGGAYVDLADLYRVQGRDGDGEKILRQGLAASPRDPGVHHALGLALVRLKRLPEAVGELKRAAELAPDDPRFAYVYGMALDAAGDAKRAMQILRAASARHPGSRSLLEALLTVSARAGDADSARDALQKLEALSPGDPRTRALLRELASPPSP